MSADHRASPTEKSALSSRRALITGLSGPVLLEAEAQFLAEVRPCGIILFARNCENHDQIRTLISDALTAIGDSPADQTSDDPKSGNRKSGNQTLVLIDQEGGRVQRLRPPLGLALPPAAAFGELALTDPTGARQAAFHIARLVAADLRALGINTNCAPVLDVPVPGAHDIIGDRAYGTTVDVIVSLAEAVADGYIAGGVVPVIKHIPGHGRATTDSHFDLPVVMTDHATLSASDFAPFKALARMPAAMTAHVVYGALDGTGPATTSKRLIDGIIRGEIGFHGLLMSDDLSMQALAGSIADRAERAISAGCDVVLHCNGNLAEMEAAASGSPQLSGVAADRVAAALTVTANIEPFDRTAALASLARVLSLPPRPATTVSTESV